MSTAFRRWSRSIVAALAALMLVAAVPLASVPDAHAAAPLQTHV
jgi:hypothetical protein